MIEAIVIFPLAFSISRTFRNVITAGLLWAVPSHLIAIDIAGLAIESLQSEFIEVQDVVADVEFLSADEFLFTLSAVSLSHKDYGKITDFEFTCSFTIRKDHSVACARGLIHARQGDKGLISGTVNVYSGPNESLSGQLGITGSNLSIQAIAPLLKYAIPRLQGYEFLSGDLNLSADIQFNNNNPEQLAATLQMKNLSIEGENVLETVDANLQLDGQRQDSKWQFDSQMNITAGVMYIMPGFEVLGDTPGFYIDLNRTALEIKADGRIDTSSRQMTLQAFEFNHHDLLSIAGNARVDLSGTAKIALLNLDINAADLAAVYPVYIEPLLLSTNYGDLELAGSLKMGLSYMDNTLSGLSLVLKDVYLDDENERFSVSGLSSDITIGNRGLQTISSLDWQSLSVYKIIFGSGDITMTSGDNKLDVIDWRDVDVLDGTLLINQLSLSDIGQEGFKLTLHGELTPVSLKTFTQTLGWPLMSGRLSGVIDGLEYSHGGLRVNGDLVFRVFDGNITLDGLRIENLFDINSRFYTNISVNDLDLEQVTETFSFGKIEGTMDGYVRNLTLINWQPVFFDAVLKNPEKDKRPHRISQKALDNLSEIGGGMPGVLSQGFIRFIPEYSYGRLGIRCLLSNRICNLGGVEETTDGFYIMTRGGLLPPWVDVKGTGRSIIWKDLVNGLKQIAEGEVVFE